MRRLLLGLAVIVGFATSGRASGGPAKPPPKGKPPPAPAPAPVPAPAPAPVPAPGPTPAPNAGTKPAGKDWSGQTGDVKFVVGYEEGMDEAWTAGRPAMLFFTSTTDKWCPLFAARTWTNKTVLESVKAYVPVLVDTDDAQGKELMRRYAVMVLPSVIWVDSAGNQIFMAQGDAPIEMFTSAADTAKMRAPEVKLPEEIQFVERVRADLKKATDAANVRKMLDAATALSTMKRPKAASEEGKKVLADLDAKGRTRLADAKKALADGKTDDAKAELSKLASEYRGRDVGLEAAEAVAKLEGAGAGGK